MRSRVEWFARRWWSGRLGWVGAVLQVAAAPLSWAWWCAATLRGRRSVHAGADRVPGLKVVSVGNLAVGGTGKTPVARWITARLRSSGLTPAVLLRGYGEDEVLLHQRDAPEALVIVGADRRLAARSARAAGADVTVLDDGFQHRRLARDLDVVLLAAEDPFPGPLLPRGPYREASGALARADAVLVTRRTADAETARALARRAERIARGVVVGCVHLAPGGWRALGADTGETPRRGAAGVLAACSVARPEAFAHVVRAALECPVELLPFADHHAFTRDEARELRRLAGCRPLVVTEKDAVKLEPFVEELGETYVLGERLSWDWGEAGFRCLLAAAVAEDGGPLEFEDGASRSGRVA